MPSLEIHRNAKVEVHSLSTMPTKLVVRGVPSSAGAHNPGQELAPQSSANSVILTLAAHLRVGAGLGLGDLATDEVFTDEALAGRVAITGGVQLSALKTEFSALKNVFEPMLLGPAAVPTWIPAQASWCKIWRVRKV
jgi:hypothetical protein